MIAWLLKGLWEVLWSVYFWGFLILAGVGFVFYHWAEGRGEVKGYAQAKAFYEPQVAKLTKELAQTHEELEAEIARYKGLVTDVRSKMALWDTALKDQKTFGQEQMLKIAVVIKERNLRLKELQGAISNVKTFVTPKATAACTVPSGFVRFHDYSATAVSNPASAAAFARSSTGDVDAPSGVALDAVATTVGVNYGTCQEWRSQVILWQNWYKDWQRWQTDYQKTLDAMKH